MAPKKKPTEKLAVKLIHQLGFGDSAQKPGEVVELPVNEAVTLIKAGHAVEPAEPLVVNSDSSAFKMQIAELEKQLAEANARVFAAEADRDSKLAEAMEYGKGLETEVADLKAQLEEATAPVDKPDDEGPAK